jgi:hypothetical protein
MSEPWSILCLAGVWGFVACTVGLILQGFPAPGVLAARPCLKWGAALLVCFVCWLAGMANA